MRVPERFLDRLARLCAIDSSAEDVAGLDACARLLAEWAGEAGAEVELLPAPAGLHLTARVRGRGAGRTLLIGHHDTVYEPGTAAARSLQVDGDHAIGPGVADMKGGLLVALTALERLARRPQGGHGLVELHSVPDEEIRLVAPWTLEQMRGADAALVLECGRESGALVSARKAGTWLTLRARGRPAHAGTEPHRGRSALAALAHEALRIEGEVHGARPGISAVVTHLRAGHALNVVPSAGEATVDLRADTLADLRWATAQIGAFAEHDGVELDHSDEEGFPPMTRSPALVEEARAILRALGQPDGEETAGGVSDGSWTSWIGVPTVDGLGPVGGLDHSPDEYVDLRSVAPRVELVERLVESIGSGPLRARR